MDFKVLKRLIGMVEKSDINELEVEHADLKVKIKKSSTVQHITTEVPAIQTAAVQSIQQQLVSTNDVTDIDTVPLDEDLKEVVSPMVGTLYFSPAPDKPPYVEEGHFVKKGDILCIIEAMKLMNEIESPYDGQVISIIVDNAQPVEFGERLFLIKPQ